ncbi:MAG: DNA-directed RNA polymerase subunit omega [Deltaproteobacteria bacterium]|nr:DNA-directed RNA polymerase subunit omega [Deltaproteobacteria bacterium]
MARITVEDCLKFGYNKFMLVHLAAKRVIQLRKGKEPLVHTSNKEIVAALREIAAGKVRIKESDNLLENDLEQESESPDKEDSEQIDQGEDLEDENL